MKRTLIAIALGLAAGAPALQASPISATLHVGDGTAGACPNGGCTFLYQGTELNGIGPSLDIFQNANGANVMNDPVLLILGVPNTTASNHLDAGAVTAASVVDGVTAATTPIGSITFGTSAFGLDGNGYQGLLTGSSTYTNIYDFLFNTNTTAPASNRFNNWHDADLAVNAIDAANFGIYVFGLNTGNAAFGAKDYIDVTLNHIPVGTFAVAYGEDASGAGYATPFTQTGLTTTTNVPEPATLALMGLGMVGLGLGRVLRRNPA